MTHEEILQKFEKTGHFHLSGSGGTEKALLSSSTNLGDVPIVYAWVAVAPTSRHEIIYLGKAGAGLAKRHKEHMRGFLGNGRGSAHASLIRDCLTRGEVEIWAYNPPKVAVDGYENVLVHSSIEEHLLSAIEPKPVRNREHRGEGRVTVFDADEETTVVLDWTR